MSLFKMWYEERKSINYHQDKSNEAVSRFSMNITPEQLAQKFHESYERLAPKFNYQTRKSSAKPWSEVPANNKKLMIAVCDEILKYLNEQ